MYPYAYLKNEYSKKRVDENEMFFDKISLVYRITGFGM